MRFSAPADCQCETDCVDGRLVRNLSLSENTGQGLTLLWYQALISHEAGPGDLVVSGGGPGTYNGSEVNLCYCCTYNKGEGAPRLLSESLKARNMKTGEQV